MVEPTLASSPIWAYHLQASQEQISFPNAPLWVFPFKL
jgi:hypothetical protein